MKTVKTDNVISFDSY